jgi:uncharacterized small protein (DUF1192 family)
MPLTGAERQRRHIAKAKLAAVADAQAGAQATIGALRAEIAALEAALSRGGASRTIVLRYDKLLLKYQALKTSRRDEMARLSRIAKMSPRTVGAIVRGLQPNATAQDRADGLIEFNAFRDAGIIRR